MPYKLVKLPDGKYRVVNARTGRVRARATSKARAKAQIRLLHDVERRSA